MKCITKMYAIYHDKTWSEHLNCILYMLTWTLPPSSFKMNHEDPLSWVTWPLVFKLHPCSDHVMYHSIMVLYSGRSQRDSDVRFCFGMPQQMVSPSWIVLQVRKKYCLEFTLVLPKHGWRPLMYTIKSLKLIHSLPALPGSIHY